MSKENVRQFYQMVAKDEELKNKIVALFKPYEGQDLDQETRTKLVETLLIPVAAERGLPFTVGDVLELERDARDSQQSEELSNEELDAVAGGLGVGLLFCFGVGAGVGFIAGVCTWIGGSPL